MDGSRIHFVRPVLLQRCRTLDVVGDHLASGEGHGLAYASRAEGALRHAVHLDAG